MRRVKAFLVLWAVALPACETGPRFVEGPRIETLAGTRAPLSALLHFEPDRAVTTEVRVVEGERRIELSFAADRDPGAGLPLVGFAPGRSHHVCVTIRDQEGRSAAATLEIEAPLAPPLASLAPIVVTRAEVDRMEPGTTLLNPRRVGLADEPADPLLLIDASGTVVWLYRPDAPIDDFEVLGNGHLLILTEDFRLVELDWLGREMRSWHAADRPDGPSGEGVAVAVESFHHDVDELPNGNLLALATETRAIADSSVSGETHPGPPPRRAVGDIVVEIEPDTGAVVWSWRALDHLDPMRLGRGPHDGYRVRRGLPGTDAKPREADWSYATSVAHDPGDDSLILSLADRGAVLKIDRATSRVLWIFGEPDGWGELSGRTFRLAASDRWPSRPQSAQPTPDGTLLVFDSGGPERPLTPPTEPPPDRYARAAEFLLDHRMAAAGQLWSSGSPGPDAAAGASRGDVAWLPGTGNILVTSSLLDPASAPDHRAGTWTRLREYTHESPPELVWEVVVRNPDATAPGWTTSHTLRLPTLRP